MNRLDGFGAPLTEEDRYPLIDVDGRRLLNDLLEYPAAPMYNHTCGDRITAEKLASVQTFDQETRRRTPFTPNQVPGWVTPFVEHCVAEVPVYRAINSGLADSLPSRFEDLPTVDRSDLIAGAEHFVPDSHPLDDLALFATTGTTTGQPAQIPSTPVAAACYGALLRAALDPWDLDLVGGPGRVAVAQICWQRSTYTFASISSFFGQGALLKLNLNPDDWRQPEDVVTFLDHVQAEVYTGDPVAFAKLADLETTHRPKALLSSAMTLQTELHGQLTERFGCPIVDVYGMNEAGPIAASLPDGSGHQVLQPHLYVEILDEHGQPCEPGQRGEITLTGGFNSALPLLRYRTGDRAALESRDGSVVLAGLTGRDPVPLESMTGRAVNTIDVRIVLAAHIDGSYDFHQNADRSVSLDLEQDATCDKPTVMAEIVELLGDVPVVFGLQLPGNHPQRTTRASFSSAAT